MSEAQSPSPVKYNCTCTHAHTCTHAEGRLAIGPLYSAAGAAVIAAKVTGSIKVDGRAGASVHAPAEGSRP